MRELTFDECNMVSGAGGGKFGPFFKWLLDVMAGFVGNEMSDAINPAIEQAPEGPPVTFDPTDQTITGNGPAWNANGSGWVWHDENGVSWYDMDGDGAPESRSYTTDDGTVWTDQMDNNWTATGGTPF